MAPARVRERAGHGTDELADPKRRQRSHALVCIAATEAEIEVAAPVHDGFLIVAPLARLGDEIGRMKAIMILSERDRHRRFANSG